MESISLVDEALRHRQSVNLQHLRRFVKPAFLPTYLNASNKKDQLDQQKAEGNSSIKQEVDTLFFLVCAASVLSVEDASTLLSSSIQPLSLLRTITVPLLPPMSAEQADTWSREYWPTVYKNTNLFGPHPSVVGRAEEEISHEVGRYMSLARRAGEAVINASKGRRIGAVAVERSNAQDSHVVAIAGDARWNTSSSEAESDDGNVLGHAVLRVIGLIARKRQELLKESSKEPAKEISPTSFVDTPLTQPERSVYQSSSLKRGGYLCVDLEIYLTHEPCVMCSMAILHSRFGRVVFEHRTPKTGGLSAEEDRIIVGNKNPEKGYGLFWRPELNWKLLAWQWSPHESLPSAPVASDIHA